MIGTYEDIAGRYAKRVSRKHLVCLSPSDAINVAIARVNSAVRDEELSYTPYVMHIPGRVGATCGRYGTAAEKALDKRILVHLRCSWY